MSWEAFLSSPWKTTHNAYDGSIFSIKPAPEFATGEVLLASTYRAVGYELHAETDVPAAGRALDKASSKTPRQATAGEISAESWRQVLHGALESPKQPKQSSRRFLQLCPLVPDIALYSGSARLTGNSWNPGQLVRRMLSMGSTSEASADEVWHALHEALSVSASDDLWARWLQAEFGRRGTSTREWKPTVLSKDASLEENERGTLRPPSVQFVRDLQATIRAKGVMTRRQWVSLMESIIRLGAVAHVLWLCDVNDRLWRAAKAVLVADPAQPTSELYATLIAVNHDNYLVYGRPALPDIKELASRYLGSRLGLNLLLWRLAQVGVPIESKSLESLTGISSFLNLLEQRRHDVAPGFMATLSDLESREARTLGCKKGIGSNLVEFCRYALGQRQTADQNLRGYDQGYFLKKRGEYQAAPWIVSLGPVTLLALVHCCLDEVAGPRSVRRLCEHLAWYGLQVDMDSIAESDLGHELRMLGLVLDSPDAESGMLLQPPFEYLLVRPGSNQ